MQKSVSIAPHADPDMKNKIIRYAKDFQAAVVCDSNSDLLPDSLFSYKKYDLVAGMSRSVNAPFNIREFSELNRINEHNSNWYVGFITYDVKNYIEDLESSHPDTMGWPLLFFFVPEVLILQKDGLITLYSETPEEDLQDMISRSSQPEDHTMVTDLSLKSRITKNEYLHKLESIQKAISHGDIYELNFCQEFYNTFSIDPYSYFISMRDFSPSPFSVFMKYEDLFLLSVSPERFLMKEKSRLISQPIKGTVSRGESAFDDNRLKTQLLNSPKERAENIMIVDLVRNDLSRIGCKNSVAVEELCGIYSFPHVHQMISTISAKVPSLTFLDIIKATFPMGSMTGAPKLNAMKIIEEYESVRRGLYSGTVGYISPGMDFDLNVVIRSLQYNAANHYLSYMAGGAITAMSDPEKEYEECILKAYAVNSMKKRITYAQ